MTTYQRNAPPRNRVVQPLSGHDLEDLMLYLLLVPEVYGPASGQLLVEHFDMTAEPHLALLWDVAA